MRKLIADLDRTIVTILIVVLMVAAYFIVVTRGGHLHWILP